MSAITPSFDGSNSLQIPGKSITCEEGLFLGVRGTQRVITEIMSCQPYPAGGPPWAMDMSSVCLHPCLRDYRARMCVCVCLGGKQSQTRPLLLGKINMVPGKEKCFYCWRLKMRSTTTRHLLNPEREMLGFIFAVKCEAVFGFRVWGLSLCVDAFTFILLWGEVV